MVVKPLPKWAMQRYALLWGRFKDKEILYDDILAVFKDEKEIVSVLLCHIKKCGWLKIKLHPEDSRKRIYAFKSPQKAIKEMLE